MRKADFKDHFSKQAKSYATYRPHYPIELFEYLSTLVPDTELAWDCATGNGQAAVALAPFFDQVIATDASQQQIDSAEQKDKVSYRIAKAENSGISSGSVDLITVAQALHWFNFESFYDEVKRVLKPNGVFAAWNYDFISCASPVGEVLKDCHEVVLDGFWPSELSLFVNEHFYQMPFPFKELPVPQFFMEAWFDLEQALGHLGSWSGVQKFMEARHADPIEIFRERLLKVWGNPLEKKKVYWPFYLRVGKLYSMST